jgi:hypothetical protein
MVRRSVLAVALVIVVASALAGPGPFGLVRAQAQATRFEYLRLTPYSAQARAPYGIRIAGYHACLAAGPAWQCRDFESAASEYSGDDALSPAWTTLGNEGWELVSANARSDDGPFFGTATYLFKRPRQ